jgi:hypothetical protein
MVPGEVRRGQDWQETGGYPGGLVS